MLGDQKFITRYVIFLGLKGMLGEIIDDIWVDHAILLLPEDLRSVVVMLT